MVDESTDNTDLGSKDTTDGRVPLMIEDHILDHKRQQAFHGTSSERLKASSSQVAPETLTEASPDASGNGQHTTAENDRAPTNRNGERDEEQIGNTHHQNRKTAEKVDVPDRWRPRQFGQVRERVAALWQTAVLAENLQDLGIHTGILQDKDRKHGTKNEFRSCSHGAEEAQRADGEDLSPLR